jgi:hypothetical protein
MSNLRLNLGCGARHLENYLNVDKYGSPDFKFDLETTPWPWDDNSVVGIELHHVLEHLGQQKDVYLSIIQELYRICKPQGEIHIAVPHHRHDNLLHDPTHVRPITPYGLSMFSKKLNRKWQASGNATTPLGLYLDVDFELTKTSYVPAPIWFEKYPDWNGDEAVLLKESSLYNNLIVEVDMTLIAIKD